MLSATIHTPRPKVRFILVPLIHFFSPHSSYAPTFVRSVTRPGNPETFKAHLH